MWLSISDIQDVLILCDGGASYFSFTRSRVKSVNPSEESDSIEEIQ